MTDDVGVAELETSDRRGVIEVALLLDVLELLSMLVPQFAQLGRVAVSSSANCSLSRSISAAWSTSLWKAAANSRRNSSRSATTW